MKPLAILILGVLTIIYTYKGGMKAVVWTELLQASVYVLGGISAVVLLGQAVTGGWGHIIDVASAAGKLQVIDFYTGLRSAAHGLRRADRRRVPLDGIAWR